MVNSVAFSPDGKWIVSGSFDSTLFVWDVQTGEAISGPIRGHTEMVNSVAFLSGLSQAQMTVQSVFGMRRRERLFLGHSQDTLILSNQLQSRLMGIMLFHALRI
jgi:WD40 repeat protein